MRLTYRIANEHDFEDFYECCYTAFNFSDYYKKSVKCEWLTEIRQSGTLSLIVEDQACGDQRCGVAYAQAVWLTDEFVEYAKTEMPPHINNVMIFNPPGNRSPFLSKQERFEAQAGEGLNALITHWGWAQHKLSEEDLWRVRVFLSRTFSSFYSGFNLKEMLIEVIGEEPLEMARRGGFLLRTNYEKYFQTHPLPDRRPYLLGMTREEAKHSEGSLLAQAFVFQPPMFNFSPSERELIWREMRGQTSKQVSEELNLSLDAIKARWKRIYQRIEKHAPFLLPPSLDKIGRGEEKKRIVLHYLSSFPEEYRPET